MNRLIYILVLAIAAGCGRQTADTADAINPVLGNISFVRAFGHQPSPDTDEDLRIRTHLEYVEGLLRAKDISQLAPVLQAKRMHALSLLHDYRLAGIFPRNYDHPGRRRPCFIDREGRICAVGYLLAQTAGREAALKINASHQYENLLAMNDRALDEWIASSGLSPEEAAMIQPAYSYPTTNNNHIKPEYGVSSAVLSGVNVSLAAMNGIQMIRGRGNNALPFVGLAAGAGQIVLGALSFPKEEETWPGGNATNESQKILSMVNIGLGTTGMILSAWNLLSPRPRADRRTSWNLYSFPAGNSAGLALSMTRRF